MALQFKEHVIINLLKNNDDFKNIVGQFLTKLETLELDLYEHTDPNLFGGMEGMENLKMLDIKVKYDKKGGPFFSQSPFQCLEKLEILKIFYNYYINSLFPTKENLYNISIHPNGFQGLANLKQLHIQNFSLLDDTIFNRLSQLEILDLSSSRININDNNNFFNGLFNLKELNLSNNRIYRISENSFGEIQNLRILKLNDNLIQEIHSKAFQGLKLLNVLDLSRNSLRKVDETLFSWLLNLERIYLDNQSDCPIIFTLNIHVNAFNNLSRLRELSLITIEKSYIQGFDFFSVSGKEYQHNYSLSTAFRELVNLEILRLDNSIYINIDSFSGLVNLRELYLNSTNFQINEIVFHGLKRLEILSLHSYRIRKIHPNAFNSLESLKILYLSNTYLDKIDNALFHELKSLHTLYVYPIKEIESKAFDALENLNYLKISLPKIDEFTFNECCKLWSLDLWCPLDDINFKLRYIPPNSFHKLEGLQFLDIGNNVLSQINKSIWNGLSNLRSLCLNFNYLKSKYFEPKPFEGLINLKNLNISNNLLEKITDSMFDGLEKLESLNLESNEIVEIHPNAFQALKNLKELNLKSNRNITKEKIDETLLHGLCKLEILRFDQIGILYPKSLQGLDNLEELYSFTNKLTKIDIFKKFPESFFTFKTSEDQCKCDSKPNTSEPLSTLFRDIFDGASILPAPFEKRSSEKPETTRTNEENMQLRQELRANVDELKEYVWNKADKCEGLDPDKYRQDKCGNIIYKGSYGKDSDMGWNIDHSRPLSASGTNHRNNLQALQTSQNKSKGDKYPYAYADVDPRGVSRSDLVQTDIDKRSSLFKSGHIKLNYDGCVSANSKAVRRGDIILNSDKSINMNSKAVKSGEVFFKGNSNSYSYSSDAPRCIDGSLDMRYAVNRGCSKYG